jgi:hypothetical protein
VRELRGFFAACLGCGEHISEVVLHHTAQGQLLVAYARPAPLDVECVLSEIIIFELDSGMRCCKHRQLPSVCARTAPLSEFVFLRQSRITPRGIGVCTHL